MIRLFLRFANRVKDLKFIPGTGRLMLRDRLGSVACLLYHRVVAHEKDDFAFMTQGGIPAIAPDELEWDLRYLKDLGVRFLTFEDMRTGEFPQDNELGIIICFDDCFADNYNIGRLVLESMGIKGVFLQTSGLVESQALIWEHLLYWYARDDGALKRFHGIANAVLRREGLRSIKQLHDAVYVLRERTPFDMTLMILDEAACDGELNSGMPSLPGRLYPVAEQLKFARKAGHEIGSHGHLHLKRSNVSAELFRSDLDQSRAVLTSILGEAPKSYSFPFSDHMAGDEEICRDYFEMAATVERGRSITRPMSF